MEYQPKGMGHKKRALWLIQFGNATYQVSLEKLFWEIYDVYQGTVF